MAYYSGFDPVKAVVERELVELGIRSQYLKYKQKKVKKSSKNKVFGLPLENLDVSIVTLKSGRSVEVPIFVLDACSSVKRNITTEGLFRKAGSSSRQRDIKVLLDKGQKLELRYSVIDVANLLKHFFRDLPDPLIPYSLHGLFARCLLNEKIVESLLLACLLLPAIHMNTLAFLIEFLEEVALHSESNRMTIKNLAIIFVPSVIPVENQDCDVRTALEGRRRILELLIENARQIGVIPNRIQESIQILSSLDISSEQNEEVKKKKKKRSGSLTRVFNGIKRIVGKGTPQSEEDSCLIPATPSLTTPNVSSLKGLTSSSRPFSSRKLQRILLSFPNKRLPSTPAGTLTPHEYLTPKVCTHPRGLVKEIKHGKVERRLLLHFGKSRSEKRKNPNLTKDLNIAGDCNSLIPDRSWKNLSNPAVSSSELNYGSDSSSLQFSCDDVSVNGLSNSSDGVNLSGPLTYSAEEGAEFVCITKTELDEFENMVEDIENKIHNYESEISRKNSEESLSSNNNADMELVQNLYEKTLQQSAGFSNGTTDLLAKQLNQELKIRNSSGGNRIVRSPSARKIGSIRRRSFKASQKQGSIRRSMSLHIPAKKNDVFYPRSSLKRGRPNTVYTGLPVRSPMVSSGGNLKNGNVVKSSSVENMKLINARLSSELINITRSDTDVTNVSTDCDNSAEKIVWHSAETILPKESLANESNGSRRDSVAQIRLRNAGLVLARKKQFDSDLKTEPRLEKIISSSSIKTTEGIYNQEDSLLSARNTHVRYCKQDCRKPEKISPIKKNVRHESRSNKRSPRKNTENI